ncbi:Vibrioferrin membrane-spanning transport protein PvsC [Candidatus Nitrotoga sp. HW29]|uniref:MFS transporter n=1 Tax=Candidatus Nitrotoga sp. HW29 TaxID=2886963 RepID=UPI001EF32FEF|nr:MFS transporter [Candidatus Nitrotoga sp. HW29]CAH1903999.1 Vibrioferrin membrane-spanning transport protein PvsC [Candidatus Nitrotoga sp. HW29]
MKNERRRIVATIMVCHFIAAFAALGMPPFFALILNKSLHSEATYLAGWLYVMPTFFTAISSPWWGKLADKYGKKPLLLRAQLGLAGSFLLAGFAPNIWVFFIALSLQGLLGGTFAASNAYLATVVNGTDLTRSLTLMQWSARAALVVAPAGLGLLMTIESPIELYRYLALLPLIAALFIGWLPVSQVQTATKTPMQATGKAREASSQQVYALQFAFIFATVITFPYFIPFIQADFSSVTPAIAGLLFGLPHLIYLLCAVPLNRYLEQRSLMFMLSISYLLLAASLFGQALFPSLPAVVAWRIVMGFSMTIGFIGLHTLIAGIVTSGNAGRTFGWFESSSKWGAVIAGLIAGTAVQMLDLRAPFFIGAFTLFIAGLYLAGLAAYRLHLNNS